MKKTEEIIYDFMFIFMYCDFICVIGFSWIKSAWSHEYPDGPLVYY